MKTLRRELVGEEYYGHAIRTLFLLAALVMILSFPFFGEMMTMPLWAAVSVLAALALFGGFAKMSHRWTLLAAQIISLVGFILFEQQGLQVNVSVFFFINQLIAMVFLVTLYLSITKVSTRTT